METHLYLVVVIVAVFVAAVANAEVKVFCDKKAVRITWRISAEMVPYAGRLFLGKCMPSQLSVLPTGEGEAHFNYEFSNCNFKRLLKGKNLVFQNELAYRPNAKPKPAVVAYPIECVFQRPEGWIPPFLNPGTGSSAGRGGLVFHLALLNEHLDAVAETNVIPMGSFMPIWAAVEQKSHQPLLLLLEECVAATTPELHPDSQVYPIISNKGCLLESLRGNSFFLPRYHSSALILYLQAFTFGHGEVYIHCKLVAWDPTYLDETKKACQYLHQYGRWELLDDPQQNYICSCCDSTCTSSRHKREVAMESHGFSHTSVLGPLIMVDPSNQAYNTTGKPSP